MPALRMKTKPIASSREKSRLCVCLMSTKVSKDIPGSKASKQLGFLDTSSDFCDNVFSNFDLPDEYIKLSGVIDVRMCGGGSLGQITLGSPDLASTDKMGFESTAIFETLFSPIISSEDPPTGSAAVKDAVAAEQVELPRLIAEESDEGSSSPSDLLSSDGSNFPISDTNFDSCLNGEFGLSDLARSPSAAGCVDPQTENGYSIRPPPEKKMDIVSLFDYSKEGTINLDDSYSFLDIHQLKTSAEEIKYFFHSTTDKELDSFDPQLLIGNFSDAVEKISPQLKLFPDEQKKQKHVTLVLDLDETLVHSTLDHCEDADFTFPVYLNLKEHTVYVRQRPHLHLFLERVAEMFEIVIFTASQSVYAEKLLDMLDPSKKIISQRKYRESCTFSGGSYTKDLSILGVDLARVAIIDNSPQVFQLQINNGIPIKSWFDDPLDCALVSLLPFLEILAEADDVRPLIASKFNSSVQKDDLLL